MFSRRDFGKMALASWPLASALAKINSTVDGVRLGVQTYSFRDFDAATGAIATARVNGDISCGTLRVEDGAQYTGKCTMGNASGSSETAPQKERAPEKSRRPVVVTAEPEPES